MAELEEGWFKIMKKAFLFILFTMILITPFACGEDVDKYKSDLIMIPLNDIDTALETMFTSEGIHSSNGNEYTMTIAYYDESDTKKKYSTITTHSLTDAYEVSIWDLEFWHDLTKKQMEEYLVIYATRPAIKNVQSNPYWEILLIESLTPLHGYRYCIDDENLSIIHRNEFY